MKKTLSLLLSLLVATTLVACSDGDGTAQVQAAAANTNAPASPTTTAAVVGRTFVFPSGVPSFATTATTTVAFSNTATTPAFSIASGDIAAEGTTTFGSCKYVVGQSTALPPSPLVTGATVTVDPCVIIVKNKGQIANNQCALYDVQFQQGTALSNPVSMLVCLNENGQITINGQVMGTATLVPVTGTT